MTIEATVRAPICCLVSACGADRKCRRGSISAAIGEIPEIICASRAFLRLALLRSSAFPPWRTPNPCYASTGARLVFLPVAPLAQRRSDGGDAATGPLSKAFADELSSVAERPAAGFQMRVPQVPRMNHVWPDLQRHAHIGGTGCGGEACGVREQRLGRTHLDQRRRQALKSA